MPGLLELIQQDEELRGIAKGAVDTGKRLLADTLGLPMQLVNAGRELAGSPKLKGDINTFRELTGLPPAEKDTPQEFMATQFLGTAVGAGLAAGIGKLGATLQGAAQTGKLTATQKALANQVPDLADTPIMAGPAKAATNTRRAIRATDRARYEPLEEFRQEVRLAKTDEARQAAVSKIERTIIKDDSLDKAVADEMLENLVRPYKDSISRKGYDPVASRYILEQQGFDTSKPLYRGDSDSFHKFNTPRGRNNKGIFSSESGNYASWYATTNRSGGEAVYPVFARTKGVDIFDATNPEHMKRLSGLVPKSEDLALLRSFSQGRQEWTAIEQPGIQKALQKAGFKGFYTDEALGRKNANLAMFDPRDYRSIYATGEDPSSTMLLRALLPISATQLGDKEDEPNR